MEERKRRKQVAAVSEETKAAIIRNSVQGLGNQPVLSAAEMKKQFVKPVVNGDGKPSAVSEIDRIATETNAALDEVLVIAGEIVGEADKKFEAYKKSVDETLLEFDESYQKNADDIKALDEKKQNKTDLTLQTTAKTVTGGINELQGRASAHAERLTDLERDAKTLGTQASALAVADSLMEADLSAYKENTNESIAKLTAEAAARAEQLLNIEAIAKGAAVPIDFDDYKQMISVLNKAEPTTYPKGNNIHIVTVNVPDLWISKIVDEPKQYIYVSDEAFEKALTEEKRVQVGYYLLSALEGQKVDDSKYARKEEHRADIEALLALFPTVQRQV